METYLYNIFHRGLNRETYVAGMLLNISFCLILALILYLYGEEFGTYVPDNIKISLALMFVSTQILILISLSLRRWHDIGVDNIFYMLSHPKIAAGTSGGDDCRGRTNRSPRERVKFRDTRLGAGARATR
jgi:uncharacterized membrane protein YhaH (DUF805 family)